MGSVRETTEKATTYHNFDTGYARDVKGAFLFSNMRMVTC